MSEEIIVCPRCGKKYRLRAGAEVDAFSCKECGASVKVKQASVPVKSGGRPSSAARPKGKARGRTAARRAGRGRSAAPASRAKGRARARPEEAESQEERRPRTRYAAQRKKNNQVLIVVSGLMLVVVVVVVAIILTMGGKGEGQPVAKKPNPGQPGSEAGLPPDPTVSPNAEDLTGAVPEPPGLKQPGSGAGAGTGAGGVEEPAGGTKKVPPLGKSRGRTKSGKKVRRYHAPTDIPHLDSTAPELRKQIDDMIAVMCDAEAGGDSSVARERLVVIGKAAFPRVLAQMARMRDTISEGENLDWDADHARNLLMSSVSQCDRALRAMDFHLNSKGVQEIKIGHTRDYVRYICGLHYKRWVNKLSAMDTMPGAYDGSANYDEEEDD